jgi:hypothetical protein
MGAKQSRNESQHRDSVASSIDGTSPQAKGATLINTRREDIRSIIDLCNELIRILEGEALQEDTGWAWQDLDTAEDLSDVLTDVLLWKESATGIARSKKWPERSIKDPELEFFQYMEKHEKFLAGTIRWYLEKSLKAVHDLRTMFQPDTFGTE